MAVRVHDDKDKDIGSVRDHLEVAAKRDPVAAQEIEGPDYPDCLRYLWDWWQELAQGAGDAMGGGATWRDIEAWARFSGHEPEPYEALALLEIDRTMRHPEAGEDEPKG